jgi:hypothetical protein
VPAQRALHLHRGDAARLRETESSRHSGSSDVGMVSDLAIRDIFIKDAVKIRMYGYLLGIFC